MFKNSWVAEKSSQKKAAQGVCDGTDDYGNPLRSRIFGEWDKVSKKSGSSPENRCRGIEKVPLFSVHRCSSLLRLKPLPPVLLFRYRKTTDAIRR